MLAGSVLFVSRAAPPHARAVARRVEHDGAKAAPGAQGRQGDALGDPLSYATAIVLPTWVRRRQDPTARPAIARQWRSGMSGGLLGASKSDRSRTCASVRAPPSQLARLWASGVSDGIRPSGGSTIFEVRAPTRFTDKNTEL